MMGLNKAVASADIFGDREAELGERIKIKGQPHEIVGLVSAHGGYMPELYDARRLKVGTEDVAGVELDRTWQAELKDRPDRVVIIPLDNFQRGADSRPAQGAGDAHGGKCGGVGVYRYDPVYSDQPD